MVATERRALHPPSTPRGDGVAGGSTLSSYCGSHPVEQRGWKNLRRQEPATPQRALLWDRQPGTTASAGSSNPRASGGWAGAGVWSWALHGCNAAPEPCGQGGKQRGLGGAVPEPRHAVNSRHRSSNSSAGSQRQAAVGWKPDGAQPSTSAVPPATAPSQAQAPRDPRPCSAQRWDPTGVSRELGVQREPPAWTAVVGCPLPHCFPQPAPSVSQGMLCPKGWRREAASTRGN